MERLDRTTDPFWPTPYVEHPAWEAPLFGRLRVTASTDQVGAHECFKGRAFANSSATPIEAESHHLPSAVRV